MNELIDAICDYVRKPYTDYAIMLNGKWGSGKTYFWNNNLRDKIEKISNEGKKYKTIYISLYGVNSLEEISKKLFIETNPMLSKTLKKFVDNKKGNSIPEYVKTGLDMANLFGSMNFNSDKVDFSKLFTVDDKVLCFDDLERANIDVIDILGYINNFVEHDGIKTIIICNEEELAIKFKNDNIDFKKWIATYVLDKQGRIDKKPITDITKFTEDDSYRDLLDKEVSFLFEKSNEYQRIKEKLIGETFEFVPEYKYVLTSMINKYTYNYGLYEFYKKNYASIENTFLKTDSRNLRILKHALNDFEKIYNNVLKDYPDVPYDLLKVMLKFTIAISYEIKTNAKFINIEDNDEYVSIIFTSQILNDTKQMYLREFDSKYFVNTNVKYRFFKFIEMYIRTRILDEKLYKKNMDEAIESVTKTKDVKDKQYQRLLNGDYWKLSDFDFDFLWKKGINEVKFGKVDFKEYVRLFSVYKYLINMNLIDYPIDDLKQNFVVGMEISAIDHINDVDMLKSLSENSIEFVINDADIKDIKKEYEKIKQKTIEQVAANKASSLFKNLPNNLPKFFKQFTEEYREIPVFSRYDMNDLYKKLCDTPNYDLNNFVNILKVRYEKKKKMLKSDSRNLKKLSAIIRDNENDNNGSKILKTALLKNIADSIDNLLK